MTGETLNSFIKRVRLERAVYLMSHRRGMPITEVAHACGFSSSSDFSRSFRGAYWVPSREFDIDRFRDERRSEMEAIVSAGAERHQLSRLSAGENPDGFRVTLRDLPPRRVAYLRAHRPYEGDGVMRAIERMMEWARERGLEDGQWLGYQRDNPEIVPLEKCRYDVGLEVPESVVIDGGVSVTTFGAMTVAELELKGTIELEMRTLDWLFGTWLPSRPPASVRSLGWPAIRPRIRVFRVESAVAGGGCGSGEIVVR